MIVTSETRASTLDVTHNVGEFPAQPPRRVHAPGSAREVEEIVRAHDPDSGWLRTVSTGRNWGLGSATTNDRDTELIDLTNLASIRHIDHDLGYAVIEPGVTQAALAEALADSEWLVNCTNSSAHTSVLGNAMDRGIGARGSRADELLGLEVVLADGSRSTIGWWPEGRGAAPNRLGLGSSLLHVFTQANLGVATAGVVRLVPRPEASAIVTATIGLEGSDELVLAVRDILRQGLASGIAKLFDVDGEHGTRLAATVCVEGTTAVAALHRDEVVRRLSGAGATVVGLEDEVTGLTSRTILSLFRGELTENERLLDLATGATAAQVDAEGRGWIFFVPVVPLAPSDIRRARTIVAGAVARTGLVFKATGNVLGHDAVDVVISIGFDRSTQSVLAHDALRSLIEGFGAAGYAPYRIDTSRRRSDFFPPDGEGDLIGRLRAAFDPHGVFAPSRYST